MKTKIILTTLALASSLAGAAELAITDKTEIVLGRGVNSLTEQPYEECITYDGEKREDGSVELKPNAFTAGNLQVQVEQIDSYEKMSKYTSESLSASVTYSFVSVGMSYSGSQGSAMFSDQASVGMDMSADYGRWILTNVHIKPEYAGLSRTEFYKRCGKEYVGGYRLGQGIRVKMSVSASASSNYSQMSAAVTAAANVGAFGAGVSGAFSEATSSLLKASTLQIDLRAYGAGSLQGTSGFIRTENDATKFRELLSTYVAAMDPSLAVKTEYITYSYFPEDNPDFALVQAQRKDVASLYADFEILMDHQQRIETALRDNRILQFMGPICDKKKADCDAYIASMTKDLEWINQKLEQVRQQANQCIQATKITDCAEDSEVNIRLQQLEHIIWPPRFRYELMQAYLDEIQKR